MSDQTIKADGGKLRPMLTPPQIISDVAWIREYGCMKYGDPNNWKQVEPERYWNAFLRHVLACMDDPYSVDPESGLPHFWHAMCNGSFICSLEHEKFMRRISGDLK